MNNCQRQKENNRLKSNYGYKGARNTISDGQDHRKYQTDNTAQDICDDIFFIFFKAIYNGDQ